MEIKFRKNKKENENLNISQNWLKHINNCLEWKYNHQINANLI